jgi:methylmalonic aciduria homocystinuria type C protein
LDAYVIATVTDALQALPLRWDVRWAHDMRRPVAMQRLAHVAGLAHLAPSHLSVHLYYGPWIALRAAAIIDMPGPVGPQPVPSNPCADCEHHCMAAYRRALEAAGDVAATHAALDAHWTEWLAVRDACPTGRAYRYGDDQVRYHYTKDAEVLRAAVRR